jgi:cyclophilin family peptidyl-prolyl cis-trans isomerase
MSLSTIRPYQTHKQLKLQLNNFLLKGLGGLAAASMLHCAGARPQHFRALSKAEAATIRPLQKQYKKQRDAYRVLVMTDFGNMVVRLYNETPLHRNNFVAKVGSGFYDSLLFHRVIKDFMVQGGDPNSRHANANTALGSGAAPGERVQAEFKTTDGIYHKKGVLAAARDGNHQKASSNCQFYLVQGKVFRLGELDSAAARGGYVLNGDQKRLYTTVGGVPHLDGAYTVYGEVETGLEVIDRLAEQPTGPADRPKNPLVMRLFLVSAPKKAPLIAHP